MLLATLASLHPPRAPLRALRMNVVDRSPPWPYNFTAIEPTFTVTDWPAAKPLLAEYLATARTSRGAMYSGFTVSENRLHIREAFADAEIASVHWTAAQPALEKLLAAGVATLDEVQVQGPATDAKLVATVGAALQCDVEAVQQFEIEVGTTALVRPWGGMSRGQGFCSLQTDYTLSDWEAAAPLLQRSVELAAAEGKGSVYFGWSRCGDRLACRQAHANSEAMEAHLANAELATTLDALGSGPATLDAVRLHVPAGAACESFAGLEYHGKPAEVFGIDSGFQRFELTGYNMGLLDLWA